MFIHFDITSHLNPHGKKSALLGRRKAAPFNSNVMAINKWNYHVCICNYKILDRSKINELTERVKPIDGKYGAKFIVGSPVKAIEGSSLPNMII